MGGKVFGNACSTYYTLIFELSTRTNYDYVRWENIGTEQGGMLSTGWAVETIVFYMYVTIFVMLSQNKTQRSKGHALAKSPRSLPK